MFTENSWDEKITRGIGGWNPTHHGCRLSAQGGPRDAHLRGCRDHAGTRPAGEHEPNRAGGRTTRSRARDGRPGTSAVELRRRAGLVLAPGRPGLGAGSGQNPLDPGNELYAASPGNLELQIGARAFVRAWASTQLGLMNQEPEFLQHKATARQASFDTRTLDPERTGEVDTPNATFTIEHAGYYRVDVSRERTSFVTKQRHGRAPGG